MSIKKKIFSLSIFFLLLFNCSNAVAIPISDTYKEGIYRIDDNYSYEVIAEATMENQLSSIIIIDKNNSLRLYKKLEPIDKQFNLGILTKEDTLIIIGSGEVSIIYNKQ